MTALLEKAAFHILFRDKKKKIAHFLRTTTRGQPIHQSINPSIHPSLVAYHLGLESLLSELHISLVQEVVTSIPPQSIFDTSIIQDSTHEQPYWSRKSFQAHLARTHPDTIIPDTAIDVLWSCFCFYALQPFSFAEADDRKAELPAFERGLLLLSRQGTRLFGTVKDDFGRCWGRLDEPCNCGRRTNRIFRSISRVDRASSARPQIDGFDTFVTDDMIDAILAIFPFHPKLYPSLEQVQPLAQSLLGDRTGQYAVRAGDFAALLSLVMRLRVHQLTYDRDWHYGFLEEPSADTEELVGILVRSFSLGQDEYLAPEMVLRALDILPNLEQSFHQLWATLFQPGPSTERPDLEPASSLDTMDAILRAVSLFIPPFQTHQRSELARRVKLITFHNCYNERFQDPTDNLDLRHILQQATHNSPTGRAYLILLLGIHAQDSDKVVVGAFFHDAPAADDKGPPEKGRSTVARPDLLFQLQPQFSLFRWSGERSNRPLSHDDGSATGHTEHRNCLGDPDGSRVAVEIDADTGQATFLRGTVHAAGALSGGYEELTRAKDRTASVHEWQTNFTVSRVAVFGVEGGPTYAYQSPW